MISDRISSSAAAPSLTWSPTGTPANALGAAAGGVHCGAPWYGAAGPGIHFPCCASQVISCPLFHAAVRRRSGESMVARRGSTGDRLGPIWCCLLYTSDAADDLLCVDLGG